MRLDHCAAFYFYFSSVCPHKRGQAVDSDWHSTYQNDSPATVTEKHHISMNKDHNPCRDYSDGHLGFISCSKRFVLEHLKNKVECTLPGMFDLWSRKLKLVSLNLPDKYKLTFTCEASGGSFIGGAYIEVRASALYSGKRTSGFSFFLSLSHSFSVSLKM